MGALFTYPRMLPAFGVLAVITLAAYSPAITGSLLWDDDGHVTRADLRSVAGLWRIWFEPGATQQYYPVTHSAFWLMHRLWGDAPAGYHLVNVGLHALSAAILWRILGVLAVPGALAAAALFALHPVHVESVAWITELKNVLSGVFYLAAAFVYLRFETSRRPQDYALAFVLFALAVLSKSVTVTLPGGLFVVLWWQRGRLRWREDVRPLAPFALVGLAAGLMTIWMERTFIGARGGEFDLSIAERLLVAGRVPWFYAGKLLWPDDLIFIYPRWTLDPSSAAQWSWPLLSCLAIAAAWMMRRRTRAPFAAAAFFVVTLFPALGFFNVYPFRFSFVADHFQYLASLAVFVPAAALAVRAVGARGEMPAATALAVVAAMLTWTHAHDFTSAETLYRATVAKNPSAWLAHNNLAALLLAGEPTPARIDEATDHLRVALTLKPDYDEAQFNLGTAFERQKRWDEAEQAYRAVLARDPTEPRSRARLATVRHDRATALLERGVALEDDGRLADAERTYRAAERVDSSQAAIVRSLGRVLQRQGRREEAVEVYRRALTMAPDSFEVHNDLGVLLAELGRIADAMPHFERAVELRPGDEGARRNLERARRVANGMK